MSIHENFGWPFSRSSMTSLNWSQLVRGGSHLIYCTSPIDMSNYICFRLPVVGVLKLRLCKGYFLRNGKNTVNATY